VARHDSRASAVAGVGLVFLGSGFVGAGVWAHREVRRGLARERITAPGSNGKVVSGASAARSLAEVIRHATLESTGGRTYAETEEYVGADGSTTTDAEHALRDATTGQPVRNPDVDLWVRATALQTALMQAYLAFRLADLMMGVGASFVVAGSALAAAERR
jgi:uncharacterized protein (DUF2236 family)